jgi:hypothetical protein
VKGSVFILLLLTAAASGIASGEWTCRLPGCRNLLGVLCGRGHLLALAQGQGIYEADLERAVAESRYAAGMDDKGRPGEGTIIRQFSTCWLQTPWHDLSRHKKRFLVRKSNAVPP